MTLQAHARQFSFEYGATQLHKFVNLPIIYIMSSRVHKNQENIKQEMKVRSFVSPLSLENYITSETNDYINRKKNEFWSYVMNHECLDIFTTV